MSHFTSLGLAFLAATSISTATFADNHNSENTAASFSDFIKNGQVHAEARYRFEFVDQDNFQNDAYASTLRTRLGYTTPEFNDFSAKLEFENITVLGNDGTFNSTQNGVTNRPVVADAEDTSINELYLDYTGIADTKIRLGRQDINLDNLRFISTLNWRQDERTFDAVTLRNNSIDDLDLFYGYATRVGQNLPAALSNFRGDTHLVNAKYSGLKDSLGVITAYNYNQNFDSVAASNRSNNTYGINLKGWKDLNDEVKFKYYLEYARQSDAGDNPVDYDADYFHIKPSITWNNFYASVGYEVLGSDNGTRAIDTPLGLVHAFNGLADVFINTPSNGLEDLNFTLAYTTESNTPMWDKWKIKGTYHDFSANEGSEDFGSEIDLTLAKKINKNVSTSFTYADFNSDGFAQDTQKAYFTLNFKY